MNESNTTCPICEQGTLIAHTYCHEVVCEGAKLEVPGMEYSVCTACGADPVLPSQAKRNQLRVAEARREHMGLLSGEQIRAVRDKLALSQARAAELFGGGANAFSKYERGETLQSVAMDRLLRLVAANPWLLGFLAHPEKLTIDARAGLYRDDERIALPCARPVPLPRTVRRISQQPWKQAA